MECTSLSITDDDDEQMIDIKTINNLKITNKLSIDLILNEIINSSIVEIKSLDLSFNELNNINIEIISILKLNLSNNRLLIINEKNNSSTENYSICVPSNNGPSLDSLFACYAFDLPFYYVFTMFNYLPLSLELCLLWNSLDSALYFPFQC